MRKIIKGFNIFIAILLVTLALVVAFIALPVFGNQALIVRSGSMTPTINVGSIIVVRPKTKIISPINTTPGYQKGDIIAFRSEKNSNTIITHRITSYEMFNATVFYKTKGDANEEEDNWTVNEKQVLGKSLVTIPHAGKVLAFAKSKYGFPALIILPSFIVIILETINIIKELKKHRKITTEDSIEPKSSPTFFINFKPLKVIIPILAAGLLIPFALAFYSDTETSSGNVLQAAAVFPTSSQPTPTGITPTITGTQSPAGNVVINELMWMGSSESTADEWIELRNTTGNPINISGWRITNATSSGDLIILTGTIPANGYFLISNYDSSNTSSVLNITPDFITVSLNLNNSDEQYTLIDNLSNVIDTADDGIGVPLAGANGTPDASMERNSVPGDGSQSANWHTATTSVNFDTGALELGTPKATNGL